MIILETKGIFNKDGKIVLNSMKTIKWEDFSSEKYPELPAGTNVELSISFDENIFLSGINGIVWATYNLRQIEVIHSALLAQNLSSEIKNIGFVPRTSNGGNEDMFLINITNGSDVNEAIDYIWRSESGLRLKPDWTYPDGDINKSFELWLNGE